MSGDETRIASGELQFDRADPQSGDAHPDALSVTCSVCRTPIEIEYFDVNGHTVCARCQAAIEARAETPRGARPLLVSAVFGLGAGIAGAAIYYAVIAITNLEIGLVAILIGYMVGYSVRKGAGGRGGLRFQILAVILTYASVAMAYTPLAMGGAAAAAPTRRAAVSSTAADVSPPASRPAPIAPGGGQLLVAVLTLIAVIAALPVMTVFASFPLGLIGAFIIFLGMRQAWRMTAALWVQTLGPYRVGTRSAPSAP